jgi:hypothetical protein
LLITFRLGSFYCRVFVLYLYIKLIIHMKTIYTVIPFYYDGIEIFTNDVKSFSTYDEAYFYATNKIDGRSFDIIENELN